MRVLQQLTGILQLLVPLPEPRPEQAYGELLRGPRNFL